MAWCVRIALAVALALVAAGSQFHFAAAQSSECTFVLGFADLRALLPDVVGACLEHEHHNSTNGDAVQHTTGGLLVWRKADNWTAFTDGYRTWINGPLGLQERLNEQRFWWELNADHPSIVPAPRPGDRCHTAQLDLALKGVDAGAGNFVGTFSFTNTATTSCTFQGYPGAELRDGAGQPLPTRIDWGGGYFSNQPAPLPVPVPPGGEADFDVHWEQVPVGNETACPLASALSVTPPDEYSPILVAAQMRACGGGHLDVSAIRPAEDSRRVPSIHVKIALVEHNSGNIGCGDRVVLAGREIAATGAPLTAALKELLSVRQQTDPQTGLYDALYQSDVQVRSVVVNGGIAQIRLGGTLRPGGVCDSPRVEAQLRQTALQFDTVRDVQVWINGRPLAEVLSGR
jgi:hypothetical protein